MEPYQSIKKDEEARKTKTHQLINFNTRCYMTIKYYKKSVFGQVNKYLSSYNNDIVEGKTINEYIKALTGKKTISDSNMEALKGLGFEFEEVLPEFY